MIRAAVDHHGLDPFSWRAVGRWPSIIPPSWMAGYFMKGSFPQQYPSPWSTIYMGKAEWMLIALFTTFQIIIWSLCFLQRIYMTMINSAIQTYLRCFNLLQFLGVWMLGLSHLFQGPPQPPAQSLIWPQVTLRVFLASRFILDIPCLKPWISHFLKNSWLLPAEHLI